MSTFSKFLATLLALVTVPAVAQVVTVTLCAESNQTAPPGAYNLATAVAQADRVIFNCPPQTELRISQPILVTRSVDIDGGGVVTLLQTSVNGMFVTKGAGRLLLRNVTMATSGNVHAAQSSVPTIRGNMDVELLNVTALRLRAAVNLDANSISVSDSRFLTSGATRVSVLKARHVTARRSDFTNSDGGLVFESAGGDLTLDVVTVSGGHAGSACRSGGHAFIRDSKFTNIDGVASGRLGGAFSGECSTTIEHSEFEGNTAQSGGALYFKEGALEVTVRTSTFTRNRAQAYGGAIVFDQPVSASYSARVEFLRLYNNEAQRGGGISIGGPFPSSGQLAVDGHGLMLKENRATAKGGAIYIGGARVLLERVLMLSNQAQQGGAAVFADESVSSVAMANAIIAHNVAVAGGAVEGGRLQLINSTVFDNRGIGVLARGDVDVANSIIAGQSEDNCRAIVPASVRNLGSNLQFPRASCGAAIAVADPALDSFFVPALASPALGTADLARCRASPVTAHDVYGQVRPRGDGCSIGAVEGSIEQIANARRLSRLQRR